MPISFDDSMRPRILLRWPVLALAWLLTGAALAQDFGRYTQRIEVLDFVQGLVDRHGLPRGHVMNALAQARYQPAIVRAMEPTPSGTRSWQLYRARTVHPNRIEAGVRFWQQHRASLVRARTIFGVPEEIVVAIIGVETEYGRNTGTWRVLDALATLAFDYPRRAEFFRSELEHFFLYAREVGVDPLGPRGSYAGAMGIPQFMPGSFRRYAVDFDGDGRRDLIGSVTDAIGSVGNFLKEHGWRADEPVAFPVTVEGDTHALLLQAGNEPRFRAGELEQYGISAPAALDEDALCALMEFDTPNQPSEYWIGLQNFYVITRYNQSIFYALSVFETARGIRAEFDRRNTASVR
jgi:membrane-bound lytic murein transglycosylase B